MKIKKQFIYLGQNLENQIIKPLEFDKLKILA